MGSPLFALTPEVMRQLLSAATRTAVESNWVVASVPAPNQITVALHNPAAAIPYIDATAAPYYAGGLVQFITGRLGGIEPNSNGAPSATGRVSMPIKSIATALDPSGGPPTTTLTFAGSLPGTPDPGDRLNVYYAQAGSFALPVAGEVNVGTITGPVTVQTGANGEFNVTSVGSIAANVTVEQASGTTFEIDKVGSITENVGTLIQNATSSPGNIQPGQGAFDSLDGNVGGSATLAYNQSSYTETLYASGGYVRSLLFQGSSAIATVTTGPDSLAGTWVLALYNGTVLLGAVSTTVAAGGSVDLSLPQPTYPLSWPNGIAQNGITLQVSYPGLQALGDTATLTWVPSTLLAAATTPPSLVGAVV